MDGQDLRLTTTMRPFSRCLSLRIDACYVEIERITQQSPSLARSIRLRVLRWRLKRLLRRIPIDV